MMKKYMKTLEDFLAKQDKKYIIFDFDETLVWLRLPWSKFWMMRNEALKEAFLGMYVEASNEVVLNFGRKVWEIERRISEDFEMNYLDKYDVNFELTDFIKNNHEKYEFYIWSSNTHKRISTILQEIQLDQHIKDIISKDKVELLKPYPDGFFQIYDRAKHERREFLFVGNSKPNDGGAAGKAGIDFFHIDYF